MENNCLVTKLKGVVNNESLPKFDMLTFHVNNPENLKNVMTYFKYADETEAIKYSYEVGSGVTSDFITSPSYPRFSGEGYVHVKNKYNIKLILFEGVYKNDKITPCFDIDISQLSHINLVHINCVAPSLHVTELKDLQILKPTLKFISIKDGKNISPTFKGDISDLAKFVNLKTLSMPYTSNMVHGTMEQIATLFPMLTSLDDLTNAKWLTGSIEDFVSVRRSQGVTEGSVYTKWGIACPVTFNGNKLTGENDTPFSWTANTITYNGVTIDA